MKCYRSKSAGTWQCLYQSWPECLWVADGEGVGTTRMHSYGVRQSQFVCCIALDQWLS